MSAPQQVTDCFMIESAIKTLIANGNDPQMVFKAVDIQKDLQTITQPSFTVAAISGKFESQDNSGNLDENVDVVVTLVVKNLANEEQRRRLIHPMVSYVVQKLHGNDLGLDMEPLTVSGWDDVTSNQHLALALSLFEIKFKTQFTLKPEAAECSYRELLSIGSTFKSETPEHETLAQGEVIFNEVTNESD